MERRKQYDVLLAPDYDTLTAAANKIGIISTESSWLNLAVFSLLKQRKLVLRGSTVGKAFALLAAEAGSISSIPYSPPSTANSDP